MSNSSLEIELPPSIDDSFRLPVENESVLISPALVDQKIKQYLDMKSAVPSTTRDIKVLIPSTNQVELISSEELRDIVYTQILHHVPDNIAIDEVIDRGMKLSQHLYQQRGNTIHATGNAKTPTLVSTPVSTSASDIECSFEEIMYEILKISWVTDSTAKSLTGYLTKFLTETNKEKRINWNTVKDIFKYSIDERTLILIFLVTYSYVLTVCSPNNSFFQTYPGYYIKELDQYIKSGVILAGELSKLNGNIKWPAVSIRTSSSNQYIINGLALSEWFVICVLALQTGYVGFRLGEKIWNMVHTVVDKCRKTSGNQLQKNKRIKQLIEQQSKLLLD